MYQILKEIINININIKYKWNHIKKIFGFNNIKIKNFKTKNFLIL